MDNAFAESFNGRVRAKFLNSSYFETLNQARRAGAADRILDAERSAPQIDAEFASDSFADDFGRLDRVEGEHAVMVCDQIRYAAVARKRDGLAQEEVMLTRFRGYLRQ